MGLANICLAMCWAALLGSRVAAGSNEEDVVAFVELAKAPTLAVNPAAPAPAPAPSERTAVRGGVASRSGVASDASATAALAVAPAAGSAVSTTTHTDIRRIFLFCVVMYIGVGFSWIMYHLKRKAASANERVQLAESPRENEKESVVYLGLLCLSWASMSVGMYVINKSLAAALEAPAVISAVQMIIAVCVVGATSGLKIFEVPRSQIWNWMFVPVLFAGMLCSSLYASSYMSLSFLTVVRNLSPMVALPIEYNIMPADLRPTVSAPIVLSIFAMLVGAVSYGDGMAGVSIVGVAFAFLNMGFAVSDRLLQRRLLTQECKDIPPEVCTIINNAVGLIPTLLLAMSTHQLTDTGSPQHKENWSNPQIRVLLLLSGLVGVGICYLGLVCQRAISATSFLVLNNVSKIAVVAAGVVFFSDPIKSVAAVGGMCLSLGGSFTYGALQTMRGGGLQTVTAVKEM